MRNEEKVTKAVIENNFFKLLTGQDGYDFICRYADVPTDSGIVMTCIEKYYLSTKDENVWRMFFESMLDLCNSEIYIWLVPYYVHSYLTYARYTNHDPIQIKNTNRPFEQGVSKFRESLRNNTQWVGDGFTDGLYGDIIRMSNNLKTHYNYDLPYC